MWGLSEESSESEVNLPTLSVESTTSMCHSPAEEADTKTRRIIIGRSALMTTPPLLTFRDDNKITQKKSSVKAWTINCISENRQVEPLPPFVICKTAKTAAHR